MRKPAKNRWSKGLYKKAIIDQRKYLWEPEYVALLAKWAGFKQGQTVVDVGCGLGYLGTIYWQFFGKGGKYCGVDISPKLVAQAQKLSKGWARGGTTEFKTGDACKLPYPDSFADAVVCQTLLMHLADPQKAVNEMYRILKPGGFVLCKEPDNLSWSLQQTVTSLLELPLDETLFFQKVEFICSRGNTRRGLGLFNAGPQVPLWLKSSGFRKIDGRMNSYPMLGIPPYESPRQKHALALKRKMYRFYDNPGEKRKENEDFKKTFFAGGGTRKEYLKYIGLRRKYRSREKMSDQQMKYGTFYWCSANQFFAIKGHKPK